MKHNIETLRKYSDGSISKGIFFADTRKEASNLAIALELSGEWDVVEIYDQNGRCLSRFSNGRCLDAELLDAE